MTESWYARHSRLIREAGLTDDCSTFEVENRNVIERAGCDPMDDITVAIPESTIREAGWVSEPDHDREVDEARQEAAEEATARSLEEVRDALLELVAAAEAGDVERCPLVSPTDVALYGPVIATARAAIWIANDVLADRVPRASYAH